MRSICLWVHSGEMTLGQKDLSEPLGPVRSRAFWLCLVSLEYRRNGWRDQLLLRSCLKPAGCNSQGKNIFFRQWSLFGNYIRIL